jgi:citrate/tricarballylate utilization protein
MSATDATTDARRYLEICNACRYCEGYCAVFPAMELRRDFTDGDLSYLANLCHNCKGCFYACQFAPPHEWGLNLPRVFGELRQESYAANAWPPVAGRLFERNGTVVSLVLAALLFLVLLVSIDQVPASSMFAAHTVRPGAFYDVIPLPVLNWLAGLLFLYALFAMGMAVRGFWRATASPNAALRDSASWKQALHDAMTLRYLSGDGHGCNERDESFSGTRRLLHHAMFYGFLLCFAATCVGFLFHTFLGWDAPYSLFSLPVLLGTVGGIGLLVGTVGLFAMKLTADPVPTARALLGGDVALLVLLALVAATGLLLLAFRGTSAMGTLLAVHFACVLTLFATLPYGKMVHGLFRTAALLRHAKE